MKREFVTIKWSDIPQNQWFILVIIDPSDCITISVPGRGVFIGYSAYFPMVGKEKVFTVVFPYDMFVRIVESIPLFLRDDLSKSFRLEFKKIKGGEMIVRNWEVLERSSTKLK